MRFPAPRVHLGWKAQAEGPLPHSLLCGFTDAPQPPTEGLPVLPDEYEPGPRRRRSLLKSHRHRELNVETLVVVDTKMMQNHGQENITTYVLTILNMVGLHRAPQRTAQLGVRLWGRNARWVVTRALMCPVERAVFRPSEGIIQRGRERALCKPICCAGLGLGGLHLKDSRRVSRGSVQYASVGGSFVPVSENVETPSFLAVLMSRC